MRSKPLCRTNGKFQFDTLVRCTSPKGGKTEQNVTVFADNRDEARAAALLVTESFGYKECRVDKIVPRGDWKHRIDGRM